MADHEVTNVLQRLVEGNASAVDELLPMVYDELRQLAQKYMRKQPENHTLQPTALANEACVRLLGHGVIPPRNRAHFFAIAATAMRQVLANHARDKNTDKRNPGGRRLTLSDLPTPDDAAEIDLIELDEALTRLAALDERQSRLVELRFFSGMTISDAAEAMAISTATAEREWRMARAWLSAELRGDPAR